MNAIQFFWMIEHRPKPYAIQLSYILNLLSFWQASKHARTQGLVKKKRIICFESVSRMSIFSIHFFPWWYFFRPHFDEVCIDYNTETSIFRCLKISQNDVFLTAFCIGFYRLRERDVDFLGCLTNTHFGMIFCDFLCIERFHRRYFGYVFIHCESETSIFRMLIDYSKNE